MEKMVCVGAYAPTHTIFSGSSSAKAADPEQLRIY
jgi:hypothetical protein